MRLYPERMMLDTDIPCGACKGTKLHPELGCSGVPCGACFGTGLSTAPMDQRRSGSTITLRETGLDLPAERAAATLAAAGDHRLAGKTVHHAAWTSAGLTCLVSWPNPHYRRAA